MSRLSPPLALLVLVAASCSLGGDPGAAFAPAGPSADTDHADAEDGGLSDAEDAAGDSAGVFDPGQGSCYEGNPACVDDEGGISCSSDQLSCACTQDAQCAPPSPSPCLAYRCDVAAQRCVVVPLGAAAPCDDGIGCTTEACDGAGRCVSIPDAAACTNGCGCDGEERCAPEAALDSTGCVPGEPIPVVVQGCTTLVCQDTVQEGRCVPGGQSVVEIDNGCDCEEDDDCPALPCQRSVECDDDRCLPEFEPDGAPCTLPCAAGARDGVCLTARCVTRAEGPTGTHECEDGADNDCDGVADADDLDCAVPDRLQLSADAELPGGGQAVLRVQPLLGDLPLPSQAPWLRCSARHQLYRFELESDETSEGVTFSEGITFGTLQEGGALYTGAHVCLGQSIEIPALTVPAEGFGVVVSVLMTNDPQTAAPRFRTDDVLLVGYALGDARLTPALALTASPVFDARLRRQEFLIFDPDLSEGLTLRLQAMSLGGAALDPERCAFVAEVSVHSVPDPTLSRAPLTWRVGSNAVPAAEGFDARTGAFFDVFFSPVIPDVVQYTHNIEGNASSTPGGGSKGAWFRPEVRGASTEGRWGAQRLPQVLDVDTPDRRAPWLLELDLRPHRMELNDAEWAGVQISTDAGTTWPLIAFSAGVNTTTGGPWVDNEGWARHRLLLPEAFKQTLSRDRMRVSCGATNRTDERLEVDAIELYAAQAQLDDAAVDLTPDRVNESGVRAVVRSARPGTVEVRCVWQVPDSDLPSVESAPTLVTISEALP